MSEITVTTENEYDELAVDLPLVVLVTAPAWCGPCRAFEPHWNKVVRDADLDRFTFVKIDAGQDPEDTFNHWASKRFGIRGVPFVFVSDSDGNVGDIRSRAVVPLKRELSEIE